MLYRDFETTEAIDAEYDMGIVVGDVAPHFAFYIEQSERARAELDALLDVPFGPTVEETLDIFPAASPDAPIVVFIHGGYWRRLSSKEFSYVARGLVTRGITAVVTNYALCPKVTIPEITRQSRAAVAFVRNTAIAFNGDRERIFVAGHSAGGHLSARTLCTRWADDYGLPADVVKGAFGISGLYDLRPIRYASIQCAVQLDEDVIQKESPLFHIPDSAPPFVALVGGDESREFRRQSRTFIDAWCGAGLHGEYVEADGKNHFTVIDDFNDPDSALVDRLVSFTGG